MPQDQIQEQVTTGQAPVLPGAPRPTPAPEEVQRATLRADARQEYLAGGPLWLSRYPRALSHAIDDLTLAFGADLYARMLNDAAVVSSLNILRSSILEDGIHLVSLKDDKDDPDYERAKEIQDFCERVLSDLTCDLSAVLWDMLEALGTGYRVAELVYEDDSSYTGKQQIALRRLNPKPNNASAFVVDSHFNVLGLLGLIPGNALSFTGFGSIITNLQEQANLLPREKFAVCTFRPHDNDPRGSSVLRPAYTYWRLKSDLWAEYEKYLVQFASPVPVGFAGPEAQATPERAPDGSVVTYPDGSPKMVTPQQAILNALLGYRNGAALAFPHGADVKTLFPGGSGEAFERAFNLLDKQIATAILHQTLAQGSGQQAHSRAASEVHERVTATIVTQAKLSVQWMFRRDVLRPLVTYNYGPDAARLVPEVSLGATETENFAENVTALASAGYTLDQSQYPEIDTSLGLPEREPALLAQEPGALGQTPEQEQEQGQGTEQGLEQPPDTAARGGAHRAPSAAAASTPPQRSRGAGPPAAGNRRPPGPPERQHSGERGPAQMSRPKQRVTVSARPSEEALRELAEAYVTWSHGDGIFPGSAG